MTRRRWIADEWNDDSAILRDAQAAHLTRVLRAQPGQEFDIVAGEAVRRGVIENVSEQAVEFSLHEEIEGTDALPLIIGLSIVRFERMEWAIEKLTELGVTRIVPLSAQRSEKHLVQAAAKRAERWQKIARESAQQSRRSDVPKIAEPISIPDWLNEKSIGTRFVLSEQERVLSLRAALTSSEFSKSEIIHAAIGPEGGWTERELASFAEHGWQSVSLGSRILRAETAAIAVASVVNAILGS
jgi:16S rRNA (uracil1498-N3)-methyltransferase